ncbi:hypothetical protein [Cellulosimicrobium sp. CUA-896]|uniref:hypothetical protein n=1 Tax=Cellulosimicrobium sp. CUA-896 TaxID=1517881 RepID=UPI0021009650|nr:hypothetical protein [Cellulosimicrobium sp. CUA-896]
MRTTSRKHSLLGLVALTATSALLLSACTDASQQTGSEATGGSEETSSRPRPSTRRRWR